MPGQKGAPNVDYDHVWPFKPADFARWQLQLMEKPMRWTFKLKQGDVHKYDHHCLRKANIDRCNQSTERCAGKMKFSTRADKDGFYKVELNASGLQTFREEFPEFAEVVYDHSWTFTTADFERWQQQLNTKPMRWTLKHKQDGLFMYDHKCLRNKRKKHVKRCNRSTERCAGKMKFSDLADELGFCKVELNASGFQTFREEFPEYADVDDAWLPWDPNVNESDQQPAADVDEEQLETEQDVREMEEVIELMGEVKIAPRLVEPTRPPADALLVSEDNAHIDWTQVAATKSFRLVLARCNAGIGTRVDKRFYYNFASMQRMGFDHIGAYMHFYGKPNDAPAEELFEFLMETLSEVNFDKHKHLLAFGILTEHNPTADPRTFTQRLVVLLRLLRKAGFPPPILTCNNNSWERLIVREADSVLSKSPLWIAHYTVYPAPRYPDTWKEKGKTWAMWQYNDGIAVNGIINFAYVMLINPAYTIHGSRFVVK